MSSERSEKSAIPSGLDTPFYRRIIREQEEGVGRGNQKKDKGRVSLSGLMVSAGGAAAAVITCGQATPSAPVHQGVTVSPSATEKPAEELGIPPQPTLVPYKPDESSPLSPTTVTPVSSSLFSPVELEKHGIHVVREGETAWGIARKYEISLEQMAELNNLSLDDLSLIYPGQSLVFRKQSPEEQGAGWGIGGKRAEAGKKEEYLVAGGVWVVFPPPNENQKQISETDKESWLNLIGYYYGVTAPAVLGRLWWLEGTVLEVYEPTDGHQGAKLGMIAINTPNPRDDIFNREHDMGHTTGYPTISPGWTEGVAEFLAQKAMGMTRDKYVGCSGCPEIKDVYDKYNNDQFLKPDKSFYDSGVYTRFYYQLAAEAIRRLEEQKPGLLEHLTQRYQHYLVDELGYAPGSNKYLEAVGIYDPDRGNVDRERFERWVEEYWPGGWEEVKKHRVLFLK